MKEQYVIDFSMRSIPVSILWNYISTPHGLEQWFADRVTLNGKVFTFEWHKTQSTAVIVSQRAPHTFKLRWLEHENVKPGEKTYFEFKIEHSELTDSTTLAITDFATPDDREESIELWEYEIDKLKRKLGCT